MKVLAEYWAARLVLASLAHVPLPLAHWLARRYVSSLDKLVPRLRRTSYRNLRLALPDLDEQEVTDGVFRSIARMLVAFARFPAINESNIHKWIRYEGLEHFERAIQRGRGVLFATAHLGNWELSAYGHALMTGPMNVVVRPLDNPLVDKLVEQRRVLAGNGLIGKKDASRAILRALGRNEAAGILIDQNVSLAEGTFVDFFGTPACAGLAFARIANHTGAAVIPGFALWSAAEAKYLLKFYPEIQMTGNAEADTARIHCQLESVIREHPDQWIWLHRRWKTRPAGEAPIY